MLVGTMMASEVPTQSCMRTSSGTPRMRKTSNSTGTMTAPPPMPNRPASTPVTTPLANIPSTSSAISPGGTPNMGFIPSCRTGSCGHDPGLDVVAHEGERIEKCLCDGARLDALGREVAAKQPRTRQGVKETDRMARDGVEPRAARDLALEIGNERQSRLSRRVERRRLAEQLRVDTEQPPRVLVGG